VSATHDYEELHELVDRLSPEQARHLRGLVAADPDLSAYGEPGGTYALDVPRAPHGDRDRLATRGCVAGGPADLAERAGDYLQDYFSQLA
jgi:hypothetical protein